MNRSGSSAKAKRKVVYMHMLDAETVGQWVGLTEGGAVSVELPESTIAENLKPRVSDSCALCRAKGSLAAASIMEGVIKLTGSTPFKDGTLIPQSQYLPIAAFHDRQYPAVMQRVAEALREYDVVIARPFLLDQPQKPIARVGQSLVEVYGDYCGRGHVVVPYFEWEIAKPDEVVDANSPDVVE